MLRLVRIAAISYGLGRLKSRIDRRMSRMVWQAVAGALLLAGAGFLLSAAWIYLAQQSTALIASLTIGGVFVVVGIVVVGMIAAAARPPPQPAVLPHASEPFVLNVPDANVMTTLVAAGLGYVLARTLFHR